jgi:hypothetical protein
LQSIRLAENDNAEEYYDDDYDDDEYDYDEDNDTTFAPLDRPRQRQNNSPSRRVRGGSDLEYSNQASSIDDEEETTGNFWSNPESSLDPAPPLARRPSSQSTGLVPTTNKRRPPPRRRTTFRSGIPEPPPPVTDFYNRLFWYGFDPTQENANDSPADKTMFGGTKGKFNGLAYMYDGGLTMPDNQRRRQPRKTNRNREFGDDDEDYWDEQEYDDYIDHDNNYDDKVCSSDSSSRNVTPPYDSPSMRASRNIPVPPKPSARRRPRRKRPRIEDVDDFDRPSSGRGTSRQSPVASWFDVEMEQEDDDYSVGRRRRRSDPREDDADKPLNPFEIFFGLNRQNLNRQAEVYNRQMGLEQSPPQGRRQRRRSRGRPGFAYPYDAEEDDHSDTPPVAEFETVLEQEDFIIDVKASKGREGEKPKKASVDQASPSPPAKRELSWEERSMAIERVPPADVQAWGPSGDLGIDARSNAISEATQDILAAQRRVEAKEAIVEKRREELSILKVDTELERKRLSQQRGDPRRIQQLLRELDSDVEDVARAFRYAQLQLQTARDELAEIETRHWAVLSFYNSTQVGNGIEEAFREFEESEPVVRRMREKQMEEERKKEEERMQAEAAEGFESDREESDDVSL